MAFRIFRIWAETTTLPDSKENPIIFTLRWALGPMDVDYGSKIVPLSQQKPKENGNLGFKTERPAPASLLLVAYRVRTPEKT